MKKVICIVGPSGIGKTKLSIELAKLLNGEIINADSMQVYKNLDIGTAKIKEDEKQRQANMKACVETVMQNPGWRLSLQIHRILNIP